MNAFIGLLMCSFFERGSPIVAAAATSDSCRGIGDSMLTASVRELSEVAGVFARIGEEAGEDETGEGVGDSASLAVEEVLLLLLTLVEVAMLCTWSTIILSNEGGGIKGINQLCKKKCVIKNCVTL